MSRIQRITVDDPLYPQACALREEVLLRPIGYDMAGYRRDFPGIEERLEHFVAIAVNQGREQVIGCACLLAGDPEPGAGRLMQMAVNLQRQGEGIGRRLVVAVESRAFGELGLTSLHCHALVTAAPFFASLGWEPVGDRFIEAGVPHQRMVMEHAAPAEDAVGGGFPR